MNMNAFFSMSYGVYVISTWNDGRATGCIANSVMQVMAEPATIAISISHDNYTNQCIEKSGRFAISILGENSDPSIIGVFGFKSGKDVNKFDSVEYDIKGNMPIVAESCSYITCEVINKMETDTHTVFLGKAIEADVLSNDTAMTYDYYHKVIKGKSPKNAPTYIKEENPVENKAEKYVCSICGYEYSGDIPFEELPDDYICPICGQPKSVFKKQ
ncbi:flavin reductase [Clostridium sp. BL-8]|uniref:flavin reductase n=1 Tax=Clostridium sp. BL-8 TaxID=349938 RepID=UPI00098C1618|nr:flavin reductase [Clostridium sp. BL-8]OOM78860.1 high molecular weight rubredoxin [Clostridium sp. BL-8]